MKHCLFRNIGNNYQARIAAGSFTRPGPSAPACSENYC
jgi:hypothetical protein